MTITLDGLQNFRDLGGLPLATGGSVRSGVLYRSEGLTGLTDAGVADLSASPIGVIVDFRTPMEQAAAPDRLPGDRALDVVELSVLEGALTGAAGAAARADGPIDTGVAKQILATLPRLGELYVQMLEHGATSFAEASRRVAAAGPSEAPREAATVDGNASAVLIHCTAGKDRTGVAVALVLDAVGVDRDAVIADYAASEREPRRPMGRPHARRHRADGRTADARDPRAGHRHASRGHRAGAVVARRARRLGGVPAVGRPDRRRARRPPQPSRRLSRGIRSEPSSPAPFLI